jgi:hypothetical protein
MLALSLLWTLGLGPKPAMRDFIGLNVHTVLFKPDLYRSVTSLVRDYHGIDWDLGEDVSSPATFPMSRNGVNWQTMYGDWIAKGYRIDVSAQFSGHAPEKWTPLSAFAYGESFAKYFGPAGGHSIVDSIEVGNEPAEFNEAQYRMVFENMAKGIRKGDPNLKIATCAVALGKADKYSKDVACLDGLESLIDVVNVHIYPFVEGWPTWRRSYPEDPSINYLKQAEKMIQWRNEKAPGRPIWITEFGYDSTTKPNKTTGDFAKWVGNTDEQQAKYIVRSYLVFSAMDIGRAYLYWFNDDDQPQLHGSSGLTRNYQPKPSFYAVRHLQKTLGSYRFDKVLLQKTGEVYVYQYVGVADPKQLIWAVWSPTGSDRVATVELPSPPGVVEGVTQMPKTEGPANAVSYRVAAGKISLSISERPVYISIRR